MSSTPAVPDRGRQESRPRKPIRRIAFRVGLALYVVSFFLPALVEGPNAIPGWLCALAALVLPLIGNNHTGENGSILFACGLINPLLLICLFLRILNLNPILRRLIAILALAFIPLNWILMAHSSSPPTLAIGHFAWIAGLLLMLVPEAVFGRPRAD